MQIGDLSFEGLMPPARSAALYRAAAKIPGVVVIPDAVDAAGRHGVAVARANEGERQELIFDKETKQFLGGRIVAVEDLPDGPGRVSSPGPARSSNELSSTSRASP
ncbi:hypothetical protein ACIOJD_04340 [Streptomyces sp. NPDC088116]|uniref:hypothetical protein n=1 Tax=Streptomyces sp. NPDC088116 TaxID=3365825 RepID=UPI0038017C9B